MTSCRVSLHPLMVSTQLIIRLQVIAIAETGLGLLRAGLLHNRIIPGQIEMIPIAAELHHIPSMIAGLNFAFGNKNRNSDSF
ncbi:hypothetical protein D3C84_1061270 [compost metagenome]